MFQFLALSFLAASNASSPSQDGIDITAADDSHELQSSVKTDHPFDANDLFRELVLPKDRKKFAENMIFIFKAISNDDCKKLQKLLLGHSDVILDGLALVAKTVAHNTLSQFEFDHIKPMFDMGSTYVVTTIREFVKLELHTDKVCLVTELMSTEQKYRSIPKFTKALEALIKGDRNHCTELNMSVKDAFVLVEEYLTESMQQLVDSVMVSSPELKPMAVMVQSTVLGFVKRGFHSAIDDQLCQLAYAGSGEEL